MDDDIQSVEEYLLARAEETIFLAEHLGFYDYPKDSTLEDLISTFPGSEKSKTSTAIANKFWEEKARPTLYLMPTHKEIKDRLRYIEQDGKSDNWTYYQGHKSDCGVSVWADSGYSGGPDTCGRGDVTLSHLQPTLAALDVVLTDHTTRYSAFDQVPLFPLWIIDEIDFGRFVIAKHVSREDIVKVAAQYPTEHEPVRLLSKVLADLIDLQVVGEYPNTLNGPDLYSAIGDVLGDTGRTLQGLLYDLQSLQSELPSGRWAAKPNPQKGKPTLKGHPRNFPRFLVPILVDELSNHVDGTVFNPRIHLVNDGNRDPLQIRWRRDVIAEFPYEDNHGTFGCIRPQVMVLDATADISLLNLVFEDVAQKYIPELPEWPANVHVHQWASSTVNKTELGISNSNNSTVDDNPKLECWFKRIEETLVGLDRNISVGVITHDAIESKLLAHVESLGFSTVKSMHFFNLRGSNKFEKYKILVVLGCPIPNLDGFREECQGFFHDHHRVLKFGHTRHNAELKLSDDRKYPVLEFGYGDNDVSAYYQQKSHSELYQAIHRIRPYRTKQYDRHIFLFTNKPVEGVLVSEILVDKGSWEWHISRIVQARLEETDAYEVSELILEVTGEEPSESVGRRIRRSGEAIAILAESKYERGKPGPGGKVPRFVRIS